MLLCVFMPEETGSGASADNGNGGGLIQGGTNFQELTNRLVRH